MPARTATGRAPIGAATASARAPASHRADTTEAFADLADRLHQVAADLAGQIRHATSCAPPHRAAALADLRRTVRDLGLALDQASGGWPPPPAPDEAP